MSPDPRLPYRGRLTGPNLPHTWAGRTHPSRRRRAVARAGAGSTGRQGDPEYNGCALAAEPNLPPEINSRLAERRPYHHPGGQTSTHLGTLKRRTSMATHHDAVNALVADDADLDLARHIIEFDPRRPGRFPLLRPRTGQRRSPKRDGGPTARPDPLARRASPPARRLMPPTPTPRIPLPPADVLVVTYTVAEGYALADVLTPGVDTSDWTPYTKGWTPCRGLVDGDRAPALHYHGAGLWQPPIGGQGWWCSSPTCTPPPTGQTCRWLRCGSR